MRIAIEGPELESVDFEEILDILRSLTGVFRSSFITMVCYVLCTKLSMGNAYTYIYIYVMPIFGEGGETACQREGNPMIPPPPPQINLW